MQLVKSGWYRLYWGVMLLFSGVIAVGYIVTNRLPDFAHYGETFSLTTVAATLAGVHILYSLTVYWLVQRRNQLIATIISSLILTLLLLYGLNASTPGDGAWMYIGMWLVSLLLIGTYGMSGTLGAVMISLTYVLVQNDFDLERIGLPAISLLAGSVAIAPLSYIFWQHRYINQQEVRVRQLSGMLKSKQAQSAILIQSLTDGVIVTDTEGRINLINPAASHLTGWPVEDAASVDARLVAKLADDSGKELSKQDNPFTKVLNTQKHLTQTLQLADKSGSSKVISLAISPVMIGDDNMSGVVAVMRDVSAEHAAEQQRAEFISTASHEMRTPVAAIEGYLALALSEKVSTIDNRARSYLEKAHASTQHLGKLFQDLLTSAKAEDGRLSSHPQVVEVGDFMESILGDLKISAETKGLSANFISGEGQTIDATSSGSNLKVVKPLYYVYADPDRLREVITNLFDNSVKYTDQGKVTLGLTGNTDIVQFFVRDSGAGIPTDDVPHLFQKFYRVDTSATRVVGGTGLGLFICRKIIELYGGRIWAESELGKGSTFYVNLPRLSTQRAEQLQAMGSQGVTPNSIQPSK